MSSCLLGREIKGEGSFILDYMIFMLFELFSMCNYYFSKYKFIRVRKRGNNGVGIYSLTSNINVFELKSEKR